VLDSECLKYKKEEEGKIMSVGLYLSVKKNEFYRFIEKKVDGFFYQFTSVCLVEKLASPLKLQKMF
jgi:hypothetical protein